jgi:hypothetical protein
VKTGIGAFCMALFRNPWSVALPGRLEEKIKVVEVEIYKIFADTLAQTPPIKGGVWSALNHGR